MASDTVPAAVPGPGDPPSTPPATTSSPGGMAGLLAPVAPARFDLDPTDGTGTPPGTSAGEGADLVVAGASSADFHNGNTTPGSQNSATRTEQTSVVRAWLLAGAERWRKGADARNKALDIKKARAQAYKEAVTTTVNRSEKMVGGSTSTNTGSNTQAKSDKNTGSHTSGGQGGGRGSGAGGGRGSGGTSGGGSSRNDSSRHGNSNGKGTGSGGGSNGGHSSGPGRGGSGGGSGSNTGSGSARHDKQGRKDSGSGDRGRSGTDRPGAVHNGSGGRGRAGADRVPSTGSSGRGSDTHSAAQTSRSKDHGGRGDVATQTCGDASGIDKKPTRQNRNDKHTADKKPETYKVVLDKDTKPARTDPNTAPKDGTPAPITGADKDTKTAGNRTAPGTPAGINTQGAREAGYRDGARVGQVIAQAGAYRDGARDGLTDTRHAAQQEKERLDQARQQRKNGQGQQPAQLRPPVPEQQDKPDTKTPAPVIPPKPTQPPAPSPRDSTPTTPPAPTGRPQAPSQAPRTERPAPAAQDPKDKTVPPATAAQPIQVNSVGKTCINLGAGAARLNIGHGEVRTLRAFQHRLRVKADGMTRVVEACAGLKSYAEQQLAKAIWWTEQARTVEGGEHLIGPLMKLEEAATVQVRKAEEIRKRAARAADSCRALISNVEIRYAPIYKAVCDSPHTKPAVLAYYREMANA